MSKYTLEEEELLSQFDRDFINAENNDVIQGLLQRVREATAKYPNNYRLRMLLAIHLGDDPDPKRQQEACEHFRKALQLGALKEVISGWPEENIMLHFGIMYGKNSQYRTASAFFTLSVLL
jgi:hypothetical protein